MSDDENNDSREIGAESADFSPATCSHYKILSGDTIEELEEKVNSSLVAGFIPVGGVHHTQDEETTWEAYIQAVFYSANR